MDGGEDSSPPDWQADPGTSAVVHGMLATMAEVLERLEDRLSTLEATVVGQTTATRTAAQRLATELPEAVIEPLRGRLERLDGLDARLAGVEAAVTKPDTSALQARIDALAEAVREAPAPDTSALEARLDALAQAVASLPAPDTSALEARFEELSDAVDAVPQPDLGSLQARLDGLTEAVEALAGLPAPDTAVLEARVESLAAAVASLPQPDMSALEARLDALAGAVAATSVSPGLVAAEVRAAMAEAMAEATAPSVGPEFGALLDERLAAVTAGIAELLTTAGTPPADPTVVALGLARLEADLAEARAESTMAVHAVAERLEEALLASRADQGDALQRAVAAVEAVVAHTQANASGNGNVPKGDDAGARLARIEALLASSLEHDEARATTLASEIHSTLGAGLERLLTHATAHDDLVAADVRSSLGRLSEMAGNLDSLSSTVNGMADAVARLAAEDRSRPVLAAVENASREQQDALNSLHTSLIRRIDGRTAALAHKLDTIDVDQLATDLTDRQASATRLLEQVAAALNDEHRRLETVQSLCQSVVGAVEQQAAVGSRVAELVLETRSAMRSDVERLESGLHLDSVKRQQHDQARMAQVASGVTEVVERETALVAQRVVALAATVEALRNALHVSVDGMAAAAP